MVVPIWHRWIPLLLFQTICPLWTRCSHCCPQRNHFSASDVSRLQRLDLSSWPSCVVSFVYGEVVLSPQCINLCSSGYIEQHKLHYYDSKQWSVSVGFMYTSVLIHLSSSLCTAQSKQGRLSPLTSSCLILMLLSAAFICSGKVPIPLIWFWPKCRPLIWTSG